jgi:hypothetical protein
MNELVKIPKAELHHVSMALAPNLTFQEWLNVGHSLAQLSEASQWWIGDWVNYGEGQTYGEKYDEALKLTDYAYGTLRNYASVSKAFHLSRRRDNLSFKHHAEVAPLPEAKRNKYLNMAEDNGWSVADLREHIRTNEADYAKDKDPGTSGFNPLAWATQGIRWFKQRMNDKPIAQWPSAQRAALKHDLKPIVEIYEQL